MIATSIYTSFNWGYGVLGNNGPTLCVSAALHAINSGATNLAEQISSSAAALSGNFDYYDLAKAVLMPMGEDSS